MSSDPIEPPPAPGDMGEASDAQSDLPPPPHRPAVERPALERPVRPELMNWQVLEEESRRAYFARGAPSRIRAATPDPATGPPGPPGPAAGAALPADARADAAASVLETTVSATAENEAIDGEAFLVDAPRPAPVLPTATPIAAPLDPADDFTARDQVDSILIASLPERRIVVQPGGKATLVVSLLNNGAQPALFDVHLEGWIHELWLLEPPHPVMLRPGARAAATITLAPPRTAATTAGEFPLFVVVRSTQYLRRSTRLGATLVILPFTDFGVGRLMPATAPLGAFRRSAVFALPVNSLSNHPMTLSLQGQAAGLPCRFDFKRAVPLQAARGDTGRGDGGWQVDPVLLDLQPDETADLLVRVTVKSAPLFGTRPIALPFRVVASAEGIARPPRTAAGDVSYTAPIKAWHLAAAALASLLLLATTGLLALAARLLLETSRATPERAAAAPPVAPVVIVLSQSPPVSPGAALSGGAPGADVSAVAPAAAARTAPASTNGVPQVQPNTVQPNIVQPNTVQPNTVQPNMVTRPGEAAPAAASPAAVARGGPRTPAAAAPYTYAEMFQQVALRYDLDWRLLAAQAYVESGFDTLALGPDGDMGLMQVLPTTWREWAPTVGANDPFDANANALVAGAYLDHVRSVMGKRGLPQAQWMLVAYNWGPDRLGKFLDDGGVWENLPPERAQYAADILRIARTIP